MKRGGEEIRWESSGFNLDDLGMQNGPLSRGLLPVLTQMQGRQDEAGRCGGLSAFPGQQASDSYAGRCRSVPPGNILREVWTDNS